MDENLNTVLEQAKRKLAEQERVVAESKKFINKLCEFGGLPPLYQLTDDSSAALTVGSIRTDSFYGKSATTAVREYLEMRRASGLGAANHGEIIGALKTGGFDFSTLSDDDAVAERTVAVTLGKNSSIFHKLPNGNWGLLTWYPDAQAKKQKKRDEGTESKPAEAGTSAPVVAAPADTIETSASSKGTNKP